MLTNQTKVSRASQPVCFCKYIHRYCNQTRLDGYDYCIRHILEDKTAPFSRCTYVNKPNKKRCTNAAPRGDKKDRRYIPLCPFHAKIAIAKTKACHTKKKPVAEGPVALLRYLEHYCVDARHDPSYHRGLNEKYSVADCKGGRPTKLEDVESSFECRESVVAKARMEDLEDDCCWVEKTDPLEHASAYTHKEVAAILREKLLRLQHLYCDELNVLYRGLKESRRKFLASVGKATSNASKPATQGAPEVYPQESSEVDTRLLPIWSHYRRRSGIERIFRQRVLERRAVPLCSHPSTPKPSCSYENNGLRCPLPALVCTNFCKNHILLDPNQVMFVPCELKNCTKPLLPIEERATCDLHTNLSTLRRDVVEPDRQLLASNVHPELEDFQLLDDIASLGLDAITPDQLFGLDPFGEEGTSLPESEGQADWIHTITLNPPDKLFDNLESES